MSLRAKAECFSVEDNSLVEVLHCPEPTIPSGKIACKVVQGASSERVPLREKVEHFSTKSNRLVEVPCRPELVVPVGKTICKAAQRA